VAVALVTGASRGIGRAVAERLGRDGAFVVVHYGRDETAAKDVVNTITEAGGSAVAVRAEFGVSGDVDTLVDGIKRALSEAGRAVAVDILVNNAGIAYQTPLEEVTEQQFDELFAVNVRAPFFLVQQLLPLLRDGGRIINVSSGVTRIAFPPIIAYSLTKGALDVFTRTLAKTVADRGITVNAVNPGVIDTDINASWLRGNDAARQAVVEETALGRIGQPDDIAGVVAFLASEDSRWVTAELVDASGGARL